MGVPGSLWEPAPAGKKWKYKCMLLNGLENFVDPAIVPLSERTDLPPEAKALLFTVDTLPTKGGLKSSRWYTPPSSPPKPPKNVITSSPSFLNPTVRDFTPKKAFRSVISTKSDSGSTWSPLNPAADEFSTAKASHPVASPNSDTRSGSSLLYPSVKAFAPAKMTESREATNPDTPAMDQGLAASRRADYASKAMTAQQTAKIELDPTSPVKAQDIPVRLRGYYVAPHLRPGGLRAMPGKPLVPYIEPHQRAGILPEVIPNDTARQTPSPKVSHSFNDGHGTIKSQCSPTATYQVPWTSLGMGSESNGTGSHKPCVPYLASTFEEFLGHKTDVSTNKNAPTIVLATKPNTLREEIQLPPNCCSTNLAPNRDGLQLQANVSPKENSAPITPWSSQDALTISSGRDGEATATDPVKKGQEPEPIEPKIYSTAELPQADTRVQQTDRRAFKDIQEVIPFEAMNPQPGILDLTRDALIRETGGAPKDTSSTGVDQFVSDDGIEALASDETNTPNIAAAPVGDSRGFLADQDKTLQQGDGSWMPVPCSWENERSSFDNAFIPQYIDIWAKSIPPVAGKVDMDRDEFKSGLSPLSLLKFEEPLAQPLCFPDVDQSDNVSKQLVQTAEIDSRTFANRILKRQRMLERQSLIAAKQQLYFEEDTIVNPNIPKIDIYLRPAQIEDITGISSIYNHYVLNSIIPEDQSPVSEPHMETILRDAQEQRLPFIVAIKGRVPTSGSAKIAEHVLGFAFTEFFNFGFGGTQMGASRFTGVIHLYVEPNHTRKGVGRSLIDRILVCSSITHASKEGYNWFNPNSKDDAVYGQQGGAHKFHQLFILRHIEVKEDPDHEWLKQWLHSKFFIEEVARLKSVARSSNVGTTARMLDVLIFQFEASLACGFDITC